MAKFHVSADGNPRACNAKQGNCPLAGDDKHFDTPEAARTDYEKSQGSSFPTQTTRVSKLPEVTGTDKPSQLSLDDIHPNVAADIINLRNKLTENGNGELAEGMVQNILGGIEERFKEMGSAKKAETETKSQDSSFPTIQHTTQATRVAKLPVVKGIVYEVDPYGEDKTEEGVAYTSIDAFREKKNGERSRVAAITVYDNGTALVWDRTEANEADIRSRDKLRDSLKETFDISTMSSPVFRY